MAIDEVKTENTVDKIVNIVLVLDTCETTHPYRDLIRNIFTRKNLSKQIRLCLIMLIYFTRKKC